MPKFKIPVTKDVTMTGYVSVEKDTLHGAVTDALTRARAGDLDEPYQLDDCMGGDPYFADDFQSDESEFIVDSMAEHFAKMRAEDKAKAENHQRSVIANTLERVEIGIQEQGDSELEDDFSDLKAIVEQMEAKIYGED